MTEHNQAHAAMMALNLARLTTICGFDLRQTETISEPMCSPSRSQSVQIIRSCALRASFFKFVSTCFMAWADQRCIHERHLQMTLS